MITVKDSERCVIDPSPDPDIARYKCATCGEYLHHLEGSMPCGAPIVESEHSLENYQAPPDDDEDDEEDNDLPISPI